MKFVKSVLFALMIFVGSVAIADSLADAIQKVHTSSAGKLIYVYGGNIYMANDQSVAVDGGGYLSLANTVCDFSKPWTAEYWSFIYCMAK